MSVLGQIVDLNEGHGYGFIKQENEDDRVFFHVRDIAVSSIEPHINELVEFDVESDLNGCRLALNISPTLMK
ncbi:cold shock domain-containing protein [Vibrio europaeus]|uniref:cold shock domain-containing protein n=1 Tax=Vibrio europaeus TaxID=300876 RepID=UPI00233E6A66|nr:cold shock domain-containing protein [Vibrio europaeus]MDC5806050.1 cold shock domain-containing protein [Vibrio europaeus]MDC5825878.1 cold shock domain-containing protein [Vibrio europaeus]MDC5831241.1 cold shock domain-containing protein [Vibrio europaeus]MDC5834197.1 cold shock domain-containing protein [Vibrio europaeus]